MAACSLTAETKVSTTNAWLCRLVALACQRFPATDLRVLICGGGDGLLAREILKSKQVSSIDLLEIDDEVLQLARTELKELNGNSLDDSRLQVHLGDAWDFLSSSRETYQVILCDLTVPKDIISTRLAQCRVVSKTAQLARWT